MNAEFTRIDPPSLKPRPVGEINRGSSAVVRLRRTKADERASVDFAASDTLASLRSPSEAPASRPGAGELHCSRRLNAEENQPHSMVTGGLSLIRYTTAPTSRISLVILWETCFRKS